MANSASDDRKETNFEDFMLGVVHPPDHKKGGWAFYLIYPDKRVVKLAEFPSDNERDALTFRVSVWTIIQALIDASQELSTNVRPRTHQKRLHAVKGIQVESLEGPQSPTPPRKSGSPRRA